MIPDARTRVVQHTSDSSQRKIKQRMQADIQYYMQAGPDAIEERLKELDGEWDIERTLEANAATLSLVSFILGSKVHPRFYWLSAGVAGFLLQHAIQGWCPPLPVFRRMGIRTTEEIDAERFALKMIRGDLKKIQQSSEAGFVDVADMTTLLEAAKLA
jgi:hypothetical protein